jgi:multidrug efflux pump
MLFSGIVALTLSPALAALLIKAKHGEKKGFYKWFDDNMERVTNSYVTGVKWVMHHWLAALGAFALVIVATVWLFKLLPTAFVPAEDQGYVFVPYFLADASSLDRTEAVGNRVAALAREHPAVENVTQVDGYSLIDSQNKTNFGLLFVSLKGYEERQEPGMSADDVLAKLRKETAGFQDGRVVPLNPPSIPGLGVTAGFQIWIEQKGSGTFNDLAGVVDRIIEKAKTRPELAGVNTTIRANGQQLLVDVDRDKAELLGVAVQDAYNTLQTMFGSLYVNQFPKDSRLYQVVLQAEPKYRMTPEDIGRFYVKNREGDMVPLSALVTPQYVVGPDLSTRFNNYPAISINGAPAPGVSSGAALQAIREVVEAELPSGYGYDWAGEAREQVSSGSTSAIAFIFGLVFVFLILAAQYESWSLPVGVMMAVPFAILGALIAIALRGTDNDLYFQIGLLTLVGLAAKNAILIVEFAVELNKKEGMSFFDAAAEAARLRLRPILMTSFAFILGLVPLAIASGASANSRHSIGTGVIGGSLMATVVAVFFIPMFYWLLSTASEKVFGKAKNLPAEAATPASADAAQPDSQPQQRGE